MSSLQYQSLCFGPVSIQVKNKDCDFFLNNRMMKIVYTDALSESSNLNIDKY
jgi:hypothetical protein